MKQTFKNLLIAILKWFTRLFSKKNKHSCKVCRRRITDSMYYQTELDNYNNNDDQNNNTSI